MATRSSALDSFFSSLFEGENQIQDCDRILISDNAKCQTSRREYLARIQSCPQSTMMNRWDVGCAPSDLPSSSSPSSSCKKPLELTEQDVALTSSSRTEDDVRWEATRRPATCDFETSSPSSPEKRTGRQIETMFCSLSRSDSEIRWDIGTRVRLDFPSSPPSSLERRKAAMKKKLLASSRWESEDQSLSLYQLISQTPPVRPTRGPNVITDIDIKSLQDELGAIKKMQVKQPCPSSSRPVLSGSVSVPQQLRTLPY